jgi:hypothetical protein
MILLFSLSFVPLEKNNSFPEGENRANGYEINKERCIAKTPIDTPRKKCYNFNRREKLIEGPGKIEFK